MIKYLYLFTFFWIVYAIRYEYIQQRHSYQDAKNDKNDNILRSLRKIRYCYTYDVRSIKWRRSLISAIIALILIFTIVWNRQPTPSEFILHLLLLTFVFALVWNNYAKINGSEAVKIGDSNLNHLKTLLKKKSFILSF